MRNIELRQQAALAIRSWATIDTRLLCVVFAACLRRLFLLHNSFIYHDLTARFKMATDEPQTDPKTSDSEEEPGTEPEDDFGTPSPVDGMFRCCQCSEDGAHINANASGSCPMCKHEKCDNCNPA